MDDVYPEVLREVETLRDAFSAGGYDLYLVGGIVRDMHLGAPLSELDFDMTTAARPEVIKDLVDPWATAIWSQGEKFGTIGAQIEGRPYEITTHRAESYSDKSRKPEVAFGNDIETDLSRRDFTLNAMAVRLSDGALLDPFDGLGALERRELRTPIEPEVSFSDDPLRILRAARFIARYDLSVEPAVLAAGRKLIDRMSIVSAERIRDEFDKLLTAPSPSAGIEFLVEVGAWGHVIPSVDSVEVERICEQLDGAPTDLTVRRAIVFSHCENRDRSEALSRLRYSNEDSRLTRLLLAGLDVVTAGGGPFDSPTVRRLIARVGFDQIAVLEALISSLGVTDRGLSEQRAELSQNEDLSNLKPVLSGDEVMDLLGLEPGPEVGAALAVLQERRFEEGPIDKDAEAAFLKKRYRR